MARLFRICTITALLTLATACSTLPGVLIEPPVSSNNAVLDLLDQSRAYSRNGQYPQSKATLERAIRLEPGNAHLWFELARISKLEGHNQQALSMAKRARGMSESPRLSADIEQFINNM